VIEEKEEAGLSVLLEAILFAVNEPVPVSKLASALNVSVEEVRDAAMELQGQYAGRGISLRLIAGGLQIVTRPEYAGLIQKVSAKKLGTSLSKGALETLAVIAYKQPVTRQEIEAVRGVNAEASIDTLLEHGLIQEVGRKKTLGRPKLYGTTPLFLRKASLNSLEDLPPIRDPERST